MASNQSRSSAAAIVLTRKLTPRRYRGTAPSVREFGACSVLNLSPSEV
jgi:hypothetical protein